jgi:hypothetical protein
MPKLDKSHLPISRDDQAPKTAADLPTCPNQADSITRIGS